jgi:hypothetical protein
VLAVDQAATPKGWVPVAYGDMQISVPAGWNASYEAYCQMPRPPGTVFVGPPSSNTSQCPLPLGQGGPEAYLGPAAETMTGWTRQTVNGVLLLKPPSRDLAEGDYFVPFLRLLLWLTGSNAQALLATLTYSPRAAVLSSGPLPTVPASWRQVSFAGLSFAAPASWPRSTTDRYGAGCFTPGIRAETSVVLSTDEQPNAFRCPALAGPFTVEAPAEGVQVEEIPSRSPATPSGLATNCFHLHGLTACPYAQPAFGILYLLVTGPGLAHGGVMFEVGLAGSGAVARTIIGSLRAA